MNDLLIEIMNSAAPEWGVCDFSAVEQRLIDCRARLRLPQNAQSVITAAFPYLLDEKKYSGLNVSRYAAVADYHTVIEARLGAACERLKEAFPGESFVCFADNSPLPEVLCAVKSGIGVRGDNGLFFSRRFGSFVFLGTIVTNLKLEAAEAAGSGCLHCGKCRSACPGGAIGEGGIDPSKCLSAISQKKGELTEAEKELLRRNSTAWGCDICQTVCPLNKGVELTGITEFIESCVPEVLPGCEIDGRAYAWRGRKVIERNLSVLKEK